MSSLQDVNPTELRKSFTYHTETYWKSDTFRFSQNTHTHTRMHTHTRAHCNKNTEAPAVF
jgi:hypothetical protein